MIKESMPILMNVAAERRLSAYFDRIGQVLGRDDRRASFAVYAMGIFGDGERKSIEPIAARACADPSRADAEHQRLLHFALDSRWSDRDVRREAAQYAIDAMTTRGSVDSWILDDTGFLKQGSHSALGGVKLIQLGGLKLIHPPLQHPVDFSLPQS
jgi:SRSO17 transposase